MERGREYSEKDTPDGGAVCGGYHGTPSHRGAGSRIGSPPMRQNASIDPDASIPADISLFRCVAALECTNWLLCVAIHQAEGD